MTEYFADNLTVEIYDQTHWNHVGECEYRSNKKTDIERPSQIVKRACC